MTVAVVIPWRAGCLHRERALKWTIRRYLAAFRSLDVVLGSCDPDRPFNRAQAIIDGASRTQADVLVVADGDVWCDPKQAIDEVKSCGWAVPHLKIHRLSRESTDKVLRGEDWHGLPLSTDNRQDAKPYKGHETGTLVVLRRDVLEEVPPDPRFVGWGSEDDAWSCALRTLVGAPWRGVDDLVHLWHPPQPRISRTVGNRESFALLRRYQRANRQPAVMSELVAEAKEASWIQAG